MTLHHLKTWPHYFDAVQATDKKFEIRKNDREFESGDTLLLQEYSPHENAAVEGFYSGREIVAIVDYVLRDHPGLMPGYVIMSISITRYYRNSG